MFYRNQRELIVRTRDLPAEISKRPASDTVSILKSTTRTNNFQAVRSLPTGDSFVILRSAGAESQFVERQSWVQFAFGATLSGAHIKAIDRIACIHLGMVICGYFVRKKRL
jgi:hypothetical protein